MSKAIGSTKSGCFRWGIPVTAATRSIGSMVNENNLIHATFLCLKISNIMSKRKMNKKYIPTPYNSTYCIAVNDDYSDHIMIYPCPEPREIYEGWVVDGCVHAWATTTYKWRTSVYHAFDYLNE